MRYKTTTANRGCCAMKGSGCKGCGKRQHSSYDWLCDIPGSMLSTDMVEVLFKNGRKGYYINANKLDLHKGDLVAVEAVSGHDIGEVSLTGKLVELAMKQQRHRSDRGEPLKIYRVATPNDIDRWEEAKSREEGTMIQARQIAADLNLEMKIGDVEYQGDGNRAIFYYIADGRVDFRQLIRVLADVFHVRIEMKQIGARQEAGRIGGIGPCGRELCCSSWMHGFSSVNTSAARIQDLSLNPQKLTGMCGKLRCCMNFEVNTYVEAQRSLPDKDTVLETEQGSYHHFKSDYFQRLITYSTSPHHPVGLVTIDADRAFEIIRLNKQGERPAGLLDEAARQASTPKSQDILSGSLTRFDKKGRGKGSGRYTEGRRPESERRRRPSGARPQRSDNPSAQSKDAPKRDRTERS